MHTRVMEGAVVSAVLGALFIVGCTRHAWAPPTFPASVADYHVVTDVEWEARATWSDDTDNWAWTGRDGNYLVALRLPDGEDRESLYLLHWKDGHVVWGSLGAWAGAGARLDVVAAADGFVMLLGDSLWRIQVGVGAMRVERAEMLRTPRAPDVDRCRASPWGRESSSGFGRRPESAERVRREPQPAHLQRIGSLAFVPTLSPAGDDCQHQQVCVHAVDAEGNGYGPWCASERVLPPGPHLLRNVDLRYFLCGAEAESARAWFSGGDAELLADGGPLDWSADCASYVRSAPDELSTPPVSLPDAVWSRVTQMVDAHVYSAWADPVHVLDVLTTRAATWVLWTQLSQGRTFLRAATVGRDGHPDQRLPPLELAEPFAAMRSYDTRYGVLVAGSSSHLPSGNTMLAWAQAGRTTTVPPLRIVVDEQGEPWGCTTTEDPQCGPLTPAGNHLAPTRAHGWPVPLATGLLVVSEAPGPNDRHTVFDARTGHDVGVTLPAGHVLNVAVTQGDAWVMIDEVGLVRFNRATTTPGDGMGQVAVEPLRVSADGLRVVGAGVVLDLRGLSPRMPGTLAAYMGQGWSVDGPTNIAYSELAAASDFDADGHLVTASFGPSLRVVRGAPLGD